MRNVPEPVNSSHDSTDQDRSESTPLYANVADTNTFRLIVAFFLGFTVTVTVALAVQISYGSGSYEIKRHGSIVSDSAMCSDIGTKILKQGGNAVDAAIAIAFCVGVVQPHLTGLGSGGYMLIYDQRERKVDTIDFRVAKFSNDSPAGVPGFVAGMVLAHKLHGILPWKQLINETEEITRTGFHLTESFKASKFYISPEKQHDEGLVSILNNAAHTLIANRDLANELHFLANADDPMEFYKNKSKLLADFGLQEDYSEITEYKAIRSTSMKDSFLHHSIIVPSGGSGGPFLLENLKHVNESLSTLVSAVDAFKLCAKNWPVFSGSNIAVADDNDLYVSMVSGLGSVLGSQKFTKSGYIMNNVMAVTQDKVSQRPTVLTTPVIVLENGKVCGRRLLLGAADVRDVAQALIYLLRNSAATIADNIEAPRVRIQTPLIECENESYNISKNDYDTLVDAGLDLTVAAPPVYPSINVIQKVNDTMIAYADSRGSGFGSTF